MCPPGLVSLIYGVAQLGSFPSALDLVHLGSSLAACFAVRNHSAFWILRSNMPDMPNMPNGMGHRWYLGIFKDILMKYHELRWHMGGFLGNCRRSIGCWSCGTEPSSTESLHSFVRFELPMLVVGLSESQNFHREILRTGQFFLELDLWFFGGMFVVAVDALYLPDYITLGSWRSRLESSPLVSDCIQPEPTVPLRHSAHEWSQDGHDGYDTRYALQNQSRSKWQENVYTMHM